MGIQRILMLATIIAVVFALSACGCLGGGKKKDEPAPAITTQPATTVQSTTPTTGQEFMDLKKVHEEGALTDEEYQRAKEKLLKQAEQPSKEVTGEEPKEQSEQKTKESK